MNNKFNKQACKRVTNYFVYILALFLIINDAYADVNSELGNVWNSLGGQSVTNGADYYKGQKAGHYTMGSMYFARQKKNRPLVSVNFPEIDFDKSCYSQGVLNFGGASFINGDELKNKITSIVQQAGLMYAYMGLSSISPIIGETLQEVYSKLQELGGFLADECQAAKQIVSLTGDVMSQHSEKAKAIFSKHHLTRGGDNDLSDAYRKFPKGKGEALKEAAEKNEKLTIEDVNIAWKAIDKLKIADKGVKELMMTISGTIIITASKNDSGDPNFQYISSNVTNPYLLEALLKGGQNIKTITCNGADSADNKCLSVSEVDRLITVENSFEKKVQDFFDKIKDALEKDEELKATQQNFLANSGIPVYAIYEKLYQYTSGNPEYEQGILAEMIAWNILYNYLQDMLKEVNEAANNLQMSIPNELKEFRASIRAAQKLLGDHEMKDLSRYKAQMFMINRAEKMEDSMANDVSHLLNMAKSGF